MHGDAPEAARFARTSDVDYEPISVPIPIQPMLLGVTEAPFNDVDFLCDLKWDGHRAIVDVADAGVRVWTRTGREISRAHPELQHLRELVDQPMLLDAELCVIGDDGRPRFDLMRRRDTVHTIAAFDVLRLGTRWLLDEPLYLRRELLAEHATDGPSLLLCRWFPDAVALFDECEAREIEGLVLKRRSSKYRSGRTKDWLKCKTSYGRRITAERMKRSGRVIA